MQAVALAARVFTPKERQERSLQFGAKLSGKAKQAIWRMGDHCAALGKRYGEDFLGRYSVESGVPRGTLLRRRWLSKRFAGELKSARWIYEMLDMTFLETVAHIKDNKELLGYLGQAADAWAAGQSMSLKQFRALVAGKPIPTICKWFESMCQKTGNAVTLADCKFNCDVPMEERQKVSVG